MLLKCIYFKKVQKSAITAASIKAEMQYIVMSLIALLGNVSFQFSAVSLSQISLAVWKTALGVLDFESDHISPGE